MNSSTQNPFKPFSKSKPDGILASQHGLSLIELMISITIGLLILVALSTLFVNQGKARTELDKSNRMIDNGRYSLELLSDDLKMAGFYGEFSPSLGVPPVPASLPNPCSTSTSDMMAALQLAIQGYDAATPTSQISSPPCGLTNTAGSALSLKSGSDILVVRRASTETPIVAGDADDGVYYLQVSLCQYDTVTHKIDNVAANFTLRNKTCTTSSTTPLADVWKFLIHAYYVSPNNSVSPPDGIPTLKRIELDPATSTFISTPLVEGIEFMQIEYGLDSPVVDGAPDSYITAPTATQWPDIVVVKINMLARNTESTSGYTDTKTYSLGTAGSVTPTDSFKRHAYTQFVRLVNPASRKETP